MHFLFVFCGLVKEWVWCDRLFGKCPSRMGTVNGCFPPGPTDGAKYPVGTEKILIDVDFLSYYLNMLNGSWEASEESICYPNYVTYPGSTSLTESSVSICDTRSFCKWDEITQEEVELDLVITWWEILLISSKNHLEY